MVSMDIGNLSTQTRWSDGSAYQTCGELNQLLLGDTNRLRYEFISGNVTNYFSVVEDERQRRAEAWRKKMIWNRIVFGVLLVFFGVVIYFAMYGSPWKQWKRWRSGKGWWS